MRRIIILKYGELWLKSRRTKKRFIKLLRRHLTSLFPKDIFYFKRDRVEVITNNFDLMRFKYIPGIEYAHLCYKTSSIIDDIIAVVEKILNEEKLKFESFAVRCKRTGKHNFRSKDIEEIVGNLIKEKTHAKVDLNNPGFTLKIDIISNETYISLSSLECIGGLPYASEGICKVNNPNNLFLIIELLKRGMYIENLPDKLRKYFPKIKEELYQRQDFKVIVYDYTFEDINEILNIKKERDLVLFPLIVYSKDEIERKNEIITKDIKNLFKSL